MSVSSTSFTKSSGSIIATKRVERKTVSRWGILSVKDKKKRFAEIWGLSVASFFSGFMAFYFIKMTIISIKFKERSEGADEIYIWIPQTTVAMGSTIFFICILHNFILLIFKRENI